MRNTILVITALCLTGALMLLPLPDGLSPQGRALLAVSAGMLILWVTQAVDISASSFFLMGLTALLCSLSPDPAGTGDILGPIKGLRLAMQGFATPAWILVCCALFLAAEVDASGLGKRISLRLLAIAGSKPKNIIIATITLTLILSLIIPSPAANAGLSTVLMLGVVSVLGIPIKSNLAKSIFLVTGFGPAMSTMMVLTAGGGPVQAASFIYQGTGYDLSWLEFALYGAPMCLGCCVALYFLLTRLFPTEGECVPDMDSRLCAAIDECGPMNRQEKAIALILAITIPLWATAKVLHPIDTGTIAILAVAAVFCPGVVNKGGAPAWKHLSDRVAWGTMMLFGAVLSLGQALLDSGAASWLAKATLVRIGMAEWPLLAIIGVGGVMFALFALAFSVRSAAIGALTPTIIGFAQSLPPERQIPVWGLTLVLNFAVQFAILVPANSPMLIIAISTDSFSARDMIRLSAPLMLCALALMLILACTWWPWLGVL